MDTFFATKGLVSLPPVFRRLLLIGIDALLLPLAVWLSFWLRLAHPFHPGFMVAGPWSLSRVLEFGQPLIAGVCAGETLPKVNLFASILLPLVIIGSALLSGA